MFQSSLYTDFSTFTMRIPLRLHQRALARTSSLQSLKAVRTYAKISPDTPPPAVAYEVFDEPSKVRQRDRALIRLRETAAGETDDTNGKGLGVVDYLREELAERLTERVEVSCGERSGS